MKDDMFDKVIKISLGIIFLLVVVLSAKTCFSNGGSTTNTEEQPTPQTLHFSSEA